MAREGKRNDNAFTDFKCFKDEIIYPMATSKRSYMSSEPLNRNDELHVPNITILIVLKYRIKLT